MRLHNAGGLQGTFLHCGCVTVIWEEEEKYNVCCSRKKTQLEYLK